MYSKSHAKLHQVAKETVMAAGQPADRVTISEHLETIAVCCFGFRRTAIALIAPLASGKDSKTTLQDRSVVNQGIRSINQ